jgi:CheY-like chemotaxis protein
VRIVVCDDSKIERTQTARMLREAGHEVVAECVEGVSAIKAVGAHQPDVVVLDVVMRLKSGDVAAFELRQLGYRGGIVFVSHHSSTALRRAAEMVGAVMCPKKFTAPALLDAVVRALSAAGRRST